MSEIVAHGDGVYTVTLRPLVPAPRFRAGQCLHLALDPYEPTAFWPESRVFSIASAPAHREFLRITYAVQGAFTRRMEAELVPDREVWVKMPYGEFVVEPRGEVVLMAGGTGITAFTAFLEQLDAADRCQVRLAYGARHDRLLVYRELVEQRRARIPGLSALYFVEQNADTTAVAGRVAVEPLWAQLERPLEANYYIAGPPSMLTNLAADLRARHVAAEAIHIDAWE